METMALAVQLWPMVLALAGLVAAVAVAFYRIEQNSHWRKALFTASGRLLYCTVECAEEIRQDLGSKIKLLDDRLRGDEVNYMTLKEHAQLCENAQLKNVAMVKTLVNEMEERILKQLKEVQREMLDAIRGVSR